MLHHSSPCASRRAIATLLAFFLFSAVVFVTVAAAAEPAAEETLAVSTNSAGEFADAGTGQALSLSDDGRFVAFTSGSQNLSPEAPAEPDQVYVKDLLTDELELVSRADGAAGEPADEPREEAKVGVERPLISGDGHYVVFDTPADNLVAGFAGDGFSRHVYWRDLLTDETVLVDRVDGGEGVPSPAESRVSGISTDGRYVVFESEVEDLEDPLGAHEPGNETVYVRDLAAGTTTAAAHADEGSFEGAISRDGRYVLFTSWSTNLGPDANGLSQVYRRDTQTGETVLVSRSATGEPSDGETFEPSFVGAGGCRIAFTGFEANNLTAGTAPVLGVYLRDLCASPPTTTLVSLGEDGSPFEEATFGGSSADGNRILIAGTPPDPRHLYLRDLASGETRLIDRASGSTGEPGDGEVAWAALSGDGCRAAFTSAATNLTPQPPPSGGSNLLQAYVRQLGGCEPPPPPPSNSGGDAGAAPTTTTSPSITTTPTPRLEVRRLTQTHLRLWFSAAAEAQVRIRRHRDGDWKLIRILAVEASSPGVVAVALPRLRPGRYRLAIRLRQPGTRGLVRFLTVGHSRQ
jgi:Tol biopolymer transport system component